MKTEPIMSVLARITATSIPAMAVAVALLASTGCSSEGRPQPPCSTPSCVVLDLLPASTVQPDRPRVTFDHGAHTRAMPEEKCERCHDKKPDGTWKPSVLAPDGQSRTAQMDRVHDLCIGCHEQRASKAMKTGPELCGDCHAGAAAAAPARGPVALDLSLHQRHVAAHDGKCDSCHHVYDEASKKLVYRKGEEGSCRDCHGKADEGQRSSYRHAAHGACIGCHQQAAKAGKEAGPAECAGCHDQAVMQRVKRLDPVPRLERGQGAWMWIRAPWATAATVPFHHEAHEKVSGSCSACHHNTLRRCRDCHSEKGKAEGGGVTLEMAFHDGTSPRSCVGCHASKAASAKDCAGCHERTVEGPSGAGCRVCHSGGEVKEGSAASNPAEPAPPLAALPAVSEAFPQEVVIDDAAKKYKPSKMPHQRIVARLDTIVRQSKMAVAFHGEVTTLCAGCHHHSPAGQRPPACASCHGEADEAARDRPSAVRAYHRQCIGCHQQMGIGTEGCTDCHAATAEAGK